MSAKPIRVLVVDDEAGIRHGLTRLFERDGYVADSADSYEDAIRLVRDPGSDVLVVDIRLKGGRSGLDLVREVRSIDPDAVVIVITGYASVDTAVTAMKEGASDYLVKPVDSVKLLASVAKSLELRMLKRENQYLRSELDRRGTTSREFVTRSRTIGFILERADKIKDTPITALITGETGTGKEVLARYIHFTSNRKNAGFVSINCAALSESLLLSELFGHEKGAFTGAVERKPGKFEVADGGTMFLDEIGDMPMEIQAKLLRALEDNAIERVGGTRRIPVDVRILAATNKQLPELIADSRFREDLYYRINIVSFHLPPLRERLEDIPLLVAFFIRKYNEKYNKCVEGIDAELAAAMESYRWPGNVRELENLVNQAVLLCDESMISGDDFFRRPFSGEPRRLSATSTSTDSAIPLDGGLKAGRQRIAAAYEHSLIEAALARNGNNKSKTARELGITRKTLARKLARSD